MSRAHPPMPIRPRAEPAEPHAPARDAPPTLLLLDIGNTHCHAGLSSPSAILHHTDIPTPTLLRNRGGPALRRFLGRRPVDGVVVCSVVPKASRILLPWLRSRFPLPPLVLTHRTVRGIGIDYPNPGTIGPDRLANAIAARHGFGAPCVVVDFGTAVTFDIVDASASYAGGIIAPGLAAMTDYLHEKTALLPRIRIREVLSPIGKSTEEAMLVGAVHGYRGLVRELIRELRKALGTRRLPVVATGGYAELIAQGLEEITAVRPHLTLEGLRLLWTEHHPPTTPPPIVARRANRSPSTAVRPIEDAGRPSPSKGRGRNRQIGDRAKMRLAPSSPPRV